MPFTSFFSTVKSVRIQQKRIPIFLLTTRSLASLTDKNPTAYFFKKIQDYTNPDSPKESINFIQNHGKLDIFLNSINKKSPDSYLFNHVSFWLSLYAVTKQNLLYNYLSGNHELNLLCQDFINFCFLHNIQLNKARTLQTFSHHNQLSNKAFKKEIGKIHRREHINILGYGLDDGSYEQDIAHYILNQGLASHVDIYGFDPYANRSNHVHYLSSEQLMTGYLPSFDLVVARWSLHHVALQERWPDFMRCLKRCSGDSTVLVLEHGFLGRGVTLSNEAKCLYYLLNAIFDVIANIGLRPHFFTCTKPYYGANFFIQYLESSDLEVISTCVPNSVSNISDIGPEFPNQTLLCLKESSEDIAETQSFLSVSPSQNSK